MDYETEEQQVEALKRWWQDNGTAVIAGVVIGVVAIAGWGFYQTYGEKQSIAASDGWSQAFGAVQSGDQAKVAALADELRDEHDGTLYTSYTSLAAARVAVEQGDLDAAAGRLAWVADNAPQDDVKLIAAVRLARVDGARGDVDAGLERLPVDYPSPFTALVEEARGDLLVLAGKDADARTAYVAARESGNAADPDALTMKLDALGASTSAS